MTTSMNNATLPNSGLLVEAEAFDDLGGWVLDSQFELQMGSPYLLAHGSGKPVADATTTLFVKDAGIYNVWVRAKDWVPSHHPGRFTVIVNGAQLEPEFGANGQDLTWQHGGRVKLLAGKTTLVLHDLTGFGGRCDALFFSRGDAPPPNTADQAARSWRRRLRQLPEEPVAAGTFDVVVVGGGVPGVAAALTAARLHDRVALVQDRPYLGGNASVEIGLRPRGVIGLLVDEIYNRKPNGDLVAAELLAAEPTATLYLGYTVYHAVSPDDRIVAIDARHARTGEEIRLTAPIFIDCSGKAALGLLVGAETLFGQEPKAKYGESLAPTHGDNLHHGNTVFFRTRDAQTPVAFPAVPWAVEIAKDYANLSGQLKEPGTENAPGPSIESTSPGDNSILAPHMTLPLTHYWEYGQWLDPYADAEHIRDHLLCAIYGTFSNVKTSEPDKYAHLDLDWVAYVAAQGEFRRYKGDYILNETDIRTHKAFPDAVVQNGGAFCLHYGGNAKYDFRLKDWTWDERDHKDYDVPFRCLYSANIANLMMAGKHISVTRIAGSNTKFMGNGGQHAIATAVAAHLCKKHRTIPRGIYDSHLPELKALTAVVTDGGLSSKPIKTKL